MKIDLGPKAVVDRHMCLFSFLGIYSVTQWNKYVLVLLFLSSLLVLIYLAIIGHKVKKDSYSFKILSVFVLIYICSFIAIILNRDHLVDEFIKSVIVGRLFTLLALLANILVASIWISKINEHDACKFIRIGFYSLFIFIVLGYWQLIGGYLGIPFFIETRDWMHGVPGALRAILPSRITSIAEEPNFLAPLLIEFILLSYLIIRSGFNKFIFIGLTLVILILSFSGGAYVNLALVFAFMMSLVVIKLTFTGRIKVYHFFVLLISSAVFFILIYLGGLIFEFIYYKFQHEMTGGSSRSQFLISFIKLIINSDVSQLLLGHGLGTMSVLDEFGMLSEDYLFRISNNFILDMFWEGGVLSLSLILIFYFLLLYPGMNNFTKSNYYYIGLLMSFHLIVTATYRSEYLSTHFLWVIIMILTVYKCARLGENAKC